MHEPVVYSTYCGDVSKNRTLVVRIVARFGTVYSKQSAVSRCFCYSEDIGNVEYELKGTEIALLLPPKTQWLIEIEEDQHLALVSVTEWTKMLQTPFDDEINNIINQKVKEAQREYRKRKESEKRLYFYDAKNGSLKLYTDGTSWYNDGCRYQLDRSAFYQAIDKRWSTPKESCFILGRVRRTIGTKDGELMDFIEPISQFKEEEDYWLFGDEKRCLGNALFKMLRFSILKKEPTGVNALRIQNKMHWSVQKFLKELNMALEAGDVEKLKIFYKVVNEPQDCSDQKFILMKDEFGKAFEEGEELFCAINKSLQIYYENGEAETREASWVYQNISRCTNKAGIYLEKRQQYNFY